MLVRSLCFVVFVSIVGPTLAFSGVQGGNGSDAFEAVKRLRTERKNLVRDFKVNETIHRQFAHFAELGIEMLEILAEHNYEYFDPNTREVAPERLRKTLRSLTRPYGRLEIHSSLPNDLTFFWDKDRGVLQLSEEAWNRDFVDYPNIYLAQLCLHQLLVIHEIEEDYRYSAQIVVDFETLLENRKNSNKRVQYDEISYHRDSTATISFPMIKTPQDGFQPIDGFSKRQRHKVDLIEEGKGLSRICEELGFSGATAFDRVFEKGTKAVLLNNLGRFDRYATPILGKVARLTHLNCGPPPAGTIEDINVRLNFPRPANRALSYWFDRDTRIARFKLPFVDIAQTGLLFFASLGREAKDYADAACKHIGFSKSTYVDSRPYSVDVNELWGMVAFHKIGGQITHIALESARAKMGTHYIYELHCASRDRN